MRDILSNDFQGKEGGFPLKMALDGAIFAFKIRRVILNSLGTWFRNGRLAFLLFGMSLLALPQFFLCMWK